MKLEIEEETRDESRVNEEFRCFYCSHSFKNGAPSEE